MATAPPLPSCAGCANVPGGTQRETGSGHDGLQKIIGVASPRWQPRRSRVSRRKRQTFRQTFLSPAEERVSRGIRQGSSERKAFQRSDAYRKAERMALAGHAGIGNENLRKEAGEFQDSRRPVEGTRTQGGIAQVNDHATAHRPLALASKRQTHPLDRMAGDTRHGHQVDWGFVHTEVDDSTIAMAACFVIAHYHHGF